MSFRSLLDKSATIQRETLTADGQGGYTSTWGTLYRRVPCRFQSLLSRETALVYDKKTVFASYYVYLSYLGVKEGDRVILATQTFAVKMVVDWDKQKDMMKLAVVEVDRV